MDQAQISYRARGDDLGWKNTPEHAPSMHLTICSSQHSGGSENISAWILSMPTYWARFAAWEEELPELGLKSRRHLLQARWRAFHCVSGFQCEGLLSSLDSYGLRRARYFCALAS
jgi:hypothetical protein